MAVTFSLTHMRETVLGTSKTVTSPSTVPDAFLFLGKTKEERIENLSRKILSDKRPGSANIREARREIFSYIISFWEQSLLTIPYKKHTFRGVNLAKRPYLSPCIPSDSETFGFYEQYRWDTFFHNLGFLLAGGNDLAVDQLLNFVDVFTDYHRIPNALVSSYLSHAQPPLEAFTLSDLLQSGSTSNETVQRIIEMIEMDLLTEWWDGESGKTHCRQTKDIVFKYGLLSRYITIHDHPLLASCEDGKDHNWVTIKYGSAFLPVQLNAILYGIVSFLFVYYVDEKRGNNPVKAQMYQDCKNRVYADFQRVFWYEKGKWRGFRNYSIVSGQEGPILYGDLSSEIWPLFVNLATKQQAEVLRDNLQRYYKGDYGLSASSLQLRKGGTIQREPAGAWKECQWEYPNCWPPLMYIAVQGLKNYGYEKDALEYEYNWVMHIEQEFKRIHGFAEKSIYTRYAKIAEGFYGTVKGFGWTIAVYLSFLKDLHDNGWLK